MGDWLTPEDRIKVKIDDKWVAGRVVADCRSDTTYVEWKPAAEWQAQMDGAAEELDRAKHAANLAAGTSDLAAREMVGAARSALAQLLDRVKPGEIPTAEWAQQLVGAQQILASARDAERDERVRLMEPAVAAVAAAQERVQVLLAEVPIVRLEMGGYEQHADVELADGARVLIVRTTGGSPDDPEWKAA